MNAEQGGMFVTPRRPRRIGPRKPPSSRMRDEKFFESPYKKFESFEPKPNPRYQVASAFRGPQPYRVLRRPYSYTPTKRLTYSPEEGMDSIPYSPERVSSPDRSSGSYDQSLDSIGKEELEGFTYDSATDGLVNEFPFTAYLQSQSFRDWQNSAGPAAQAISPVNLPSSYYPGASGINASTPGQPIASSPARNLNGRSPRAGTYRASPFQATGISPVRSVRGIASGGRGQQVGTYRASPFQAHRISGASPQAARISPARNMNRGASGASPLSGRQVQPSRVSRLISQFEQKRF